MWDWRCSWSWSGMAPDGALAEELKLRLPKPTLTTDNRADMRYNLFQHASSHYRCDPYHPKLFKVRVRSLPKCRNRCYVRPSSCQIEAANNSEMLCCSFETQQILYVAFETLEIFVWESFLNGDYATLGSIFGLPYPPS